ncbi:condensation domain-containing protein, partial [Colwellia psychrerythraea]
MNLVALLKEVKNKGITLYLNDGKLAFKAPAGAMNKALKSQVVALKVELVELLEKRDSTETSKIEVIDRQPDDALVTSFPQQRLWFVDKLGRGSHQYNISAALKLSGTLKPEALEKAFSSIVSRHETLRTYFVAGDDGQPVQKIQNVDGFDVVTIDLSTIEAKNQQEEVIRYVDQETTYNFNLNSDFMLRVHVLKLSDAEHILLVTMHHIASDGWSVGVLITEFSTLYAAYAQGKGNPLAPLAVQYADYAHWQRNGIEGKVLDKQLSFWTNQLAGLPIIHSLPLDLPRPSKQRFAGHIYSCNMSKTKLDVFEQYCKDNGATLFMGLHAVFSVLLARYSNETDIVIGSPVANREQPEVEPLIGYFANTLVLRSDLSDKPTFNALLAQSKKTLLDAYANQQVPFEQVVEQLQPERSLSYSLLFQVMLVLQNNVQGSEELPDLTLSHVKQKNTVSKFDLTLNIMKNDEGLRVRWEYNTDLFKVETIKCLAEHFERLFEGLLSAPENNVFDVKMLSEPEYYQQLTTWNDTAVIYPKDKCIHELFEAQVEKTPNAIAAVFEDQKLNYSELNNKVNQLAHYLIEQKQVKPDTLVGICMERSLEMVIAIFAVLKAGGAYVPLDPDFPKARLAYMLQDANLSIVLTQIKLRGKISINDNQLEYLDDSMFLQHLSDYSTDNIDPLSQGLTSKHLAYVIYTSGSTGKPKGVMVPHSAVVHYLAHAVENYLTDNIVGSVLSSPLSFDATVTTLLTPLMAGRKIVILPEKQDLVVEGLINYFNAEYDYLFKITPAHLELLSTCNISGNAQHIVVIGGEQLTTRCLMPWKRDLLPNTIYVNEYGPTETAVGCSTYWIRELQDLEYDVHAVPIGQPINNIKFYVLYNGQPIPLGAIGELYIGGDGVTH